MDLATITGAYQGIKATKDILSTLFEAKVYAEAKPKILEAQAHLGEIQDTLFALREELFRLQEERGQLQKQLTDIQGWQKLMEQYELAKTSGGAIVYRFKGQPEHYACPSCFNKHEVHILQDNRAMSGKYRCTGCGVEFPINPFQRS